MTQLRLTANPLYGLTPEEIQIVEGASAKASA
jgi:hypothetical protein